MKRSLYGGLIYETREEVVKHIANLREKHSNMQIRFPAATSFDDSFSVISILAEYKPNEGILRTLWVPKVNIRNRSDEYISVENLKDSWEHLMLRTLPLITGLTTKPGGYTLLDRYDVTSSSKPSERHWKHIAFTHNFSGAVEEDLETQLRRKPGLGVPFWTDIEGFLEIFTSEAVPQLHAAHKALEYMKHDINERLKLPLEIDQSLEESYRRVIRVSKNLPACKLEYCS